MKLVSQINHQYSVLGCTIEVVFLTQSSDLSMEMLVWDEKK
jgi:hypothetical protein